MKTTPPTVLSLSYATTRNALDVADVAPLSRGPVHTRAARAALQELRSTRAELQAQVRALESRIAGLDRRERELTEARK